MKTSLVAKKGFTLIELVIVIVILGILSIAAAPRFIDLQSDAVSASNKRIATALKSSISLAKLKYEMEGFSGSALNVEGIGENNLDFTSQGWPAGTDDNPDFRIVSKCIELWNTLLTNPPTISTGSNTEYRAYRSVHNAWHRSCHFYNTKDEAFRISYDTTTGEVTTS